MADTLNDTPLPHWEDEPEVWDACFLGGNQLPGVCRVEVTRKWKIDKKSAKGKNGATTTLQGSEPADVTIVCTVLSREDVSELWRLVPLLEPYRGGAKNNDFAFDIASPATTWRDIKAIVIESMEGPKLVDGILTLTIKAVEYCPPAKATGKGKGTGGGGVMIGTFSGTNGDVLPGSRIAVQLGDAKDPQNPKAVLLDPGGYTLSRWSLVAMAGTDGGGFYYQGGEFVGRFIFPDNLLREAWEATKSKPALKDVTVTPDGSTGQPTPSASTAVSISSKNPSAFDAASFD